MSIVTYDDLDTPVFEIDFLRYLFANGAQGSFWGPLPYYSDAAGTVESGWGDPVGNIPDESGNGNDWTQVTSTARPIIRNSPPRLEFDGTDDAVTTTLPAISGGTIVLAGTNGIWIDEIDFAGGEFSVGPDTYTGGPEGILEVIGDPIAGGFFAIDRQLSSSERTRVITWMNQLGVPGVFPVSGVEHGYIDPGSTAPNLVPNANARTTTWFSVSEWQGATVTLSPIGGNTNRDRAQFRDASGVITYANLSTSIFPVSVEIPPDAVDMRVYFRSGGATAVGLELIP